MCAACYSALWTSTFNVCRRCCAAPSDLHESQAQGFTSECYITVSLSFLFTVHDCIPPVFSGGGDLINGQDYATALHLQGLTRDLCQQLAADNRHVI